jgi:Flp pilus assembly protein TadG
MVGHKLIRDEKGAAVIEMAFVLPILIVMIWAFVQLAQIYRALAGIQQALGQGARMPLCA